MMKQKARSRPAAPPVPRQDFATAATGASTHRAAPNLFVLGGGRPMRAPRITVLVDVYSRAILGFDVST